MKHEVEFKLNEDDKGILKCHTCDEEWESSDDFVMHLLP